MSDYNYSMKWHKFLVNFLLFLGAGLNLITGLAYIFGVYDDYNLPDSFGYVFGILSIGMAIIGIVARQKLASFSFDGPKWLTIVYAAAIGYDVLYYISYWMVTEKNAFTFFSFLGLVTRVIVLLVNMSYYEHREALFVKNSSANGQSNGDLIMSDKAENKTQVSDTYGACEWKCPKCGKIHQNYVGTCGCGERKP